MPYIHEYKYKKGYHIRAYTYSSGNINLKIVGPQGYSILEDYGFEDGDEISWDIIKILDLFNLIYTENSRKSSKRVYSDEFDPDPEITDETSLKKEDLNNLIKIIKKNIGISDRHISEIYSMFDMKPSDSTGLISTKKNKKPEGEEVVRNAEIKNANIGDTVTVQIDRIANNSGYPVVKTEENPELGRQVYIRNNTLDCNPGDKLEVVISGSSTIKPKKVYEIFDKDKEIDVTIDRIKNGVAVVESLDNKIKIWEDWNINLGLSLDAKVGDKITIEMKSYDFENKEILANPIEGLSKGDITNAEIKEINSDGKVFVKLPSYPDYLNIGKMFGV